jgi:antitoxin YefM
MILVMSKVLPLSEVKAKLSEVVDEVATTHERVTVTRNGRPVAVLVSADDLDAVEETIEILSDPTAVRAIEEGRAAIEAGDTISKNELAALRDRLRTAAE